MIKKKCAVCGKEIEVANPRYCLCSEECKRVRAREYQRSYKSIEMHKKYMREKYWKNPKIIPCKICGKPVPPTFRENRMCRKFYHEQCVLSEAVQAVREGCGWEDKRIMRADNLYGYTMSELIKELNNYN